MWEHENIFYRGGGRDLRRGRRQLRLAKHPPEQRLVVVCVGVDGRGGVGRPRLRAVQLVKSGVEIFLVC